jgi:FkbM family methyltransferase
MTTPIASLLLRSAAWAARWLPPTVVRGLYRLGPITGLLRGALNRASSAGVRVVRVAAGPLEGARLLLDLRVDKDLWLGTYEPDVSRALRIFCGPGMIAYDIGANVGYTALLLARTVSPDGQVIAFEPEKENQIRIRRCLALNPEGKRIVLVNAAVGSRSGKGRFLRHAHATQGKLAGSRGRAGSYAGSVTVRTYSLDDYVELFGGPPPRVVKVDIEGGEGLALRGMRRILDGERPLVMVELHGPQAARAVWNEFRRADYAVLHVRRGYPPVSAAAELQWKDHVVGVPRAR